MREPHCTKFIFHWRHDRIAKTAICKEWTSRHRPNEGTKIAPFRRNQTKYPRRHADADFVGVRERQQFLKRQFLDPPFSLGNVHGCRVFRPPTEQYSPGGELISPRGDDAARHHLTNDATLGINDRRIRADTTCRFEWP